MKAGKFERLTQQESSLSTELDSLRSRYHELNEKYYALSEQSNLNALQNEGRIRGSEEKLLNLTLQYDQVIVRETLMFAELEQQRKIGSEREATIHELQNELSELRKSLVIQQYFHETVSSASMLLDQVTQTDRKFRQHEEIIASKDQIIAGSGFLFYVTYRQIIDDYPEEER
ncbi:unnamed protein product [Gongylonema pulchrum]|uniref:Outer membrane efflux protein n=1 Tax=Gongylonema pulchrum TaxID=637853 RepID=A0A183CVQ3_9BILA|nr:unnamed protein product [Gongylonema pulchrum]